jgi:hypothetical protein
VWPTHFCGSINRTNKKKIKRDLICMSAGIFHLRTTQNEFTLNPMLGLHHLIWTASVECNFLLHTKLQSNPASCHTGTGRLPWHRLQPSCANRPTKGIGLTVNSGKIWVVFIFCHQNAGQNHNTSTVNKSSEMWPIIFCNGTECCILHDVQTGSGVHPTSYPTDTEGSFPGSKAAGAVSWPLTSN